ncbi:hypothetical protein M0804_007716 [Polistes exclamans]|nr:hypothetical protein M0804_007716 [Polistes exclamans]
MLEEAKWKKKKEKKKKKKKEKKQKKKKKTMSRREEEEEEEEAAAAAKQPCTLDKKVAVSARALVRTLKSTRKKKIKKISR